MPLQLNQLAAYLEGKAKSKKTVFYSEVVAHFKLQPLTDAWLGHELAEAFDRLDQEDAAAKRPFRTSMVISRENNMPGPGYFRSLEAMKGIRAVNDLQRLTVFTRELQRAIQYPW